MKKIYLIFLILLITLGCKKERLNKGAEILIGKWKWVHSSINYNVNCNQNIPYGAGSTYFSILDPSTQNTNYYLEFFEKGKVKFYQEQSELQEEKILWEMSEISANKYFYELYYDKEIKLDGIINHDTLMENRLFPFADTDCDDYTNFFVRE